MKVIESMVVIVLGVILAIAAVRGFDKLNETYYKALSYNSLSTTERNILYVFDNDRYDDLLESYEFISKVPFLGDTL